MRYALIKNGKVVNVIEAPEGYHDEDHKAVAHETANIGDSEDALGRPILPPENDDYRYKRAKEYPPIGDQLDAIMKWLATETEFNVPSELKSLAMSCMSVKSRYPK